MFKTSKCNHLLEQAKSNKKITKPVLNFERSRFFFSKAPRTVSATSCRVKKKFFFFFNGLNISIPSGHIHKNSKLPKMASLRADLTAVTTPDWLMEALQDLSVLIAIVFGRQ